MSTLVERLDKLQIEVLRLRAQLLPEEKLSSKELKELDMSCDEVAKGKFKKLGDILPELDECKIAGSLR